MIIYVIERGDTLYNIATKYGTTIDEIAAVNNIDKNVDLVVGQAITIPVPEIRHKVVAGDTLYLISRMYDVPMEWIRMSNPDVNWDNLPIDSTIIIPTAQISNTDMVVNGYMLPGISAEVLNATLPYLNYLSIFSYSLNPNGTLQPIDDEEYIADANRAGVKALLTITNTAEDGFNSDLAHSVLTSAEAKATLFAEILLLLQTKGYAGVNMDLEYIYPEDKDLYSQFLQELSTLLHANNYLLAVAVAPKTSDNQEGFIYQAHDYEAIGRVADMVIIMTYEWGYLYGEPQAISPVNRMEEVVTYAITRIPTDKILLGVSNYAYDWALPYVKGTAATYLSNAAALKLARDKGSEIMFDQKSQSPYFRYYLDNVEHIVWFEDVRTLAAKLDLVERYNLLGISYWNINFFINPSGLINQRQ